MLVKCSSIRARVANKCASACIYIYIYTHINIYIYLIYIYIYSKTIYIRTYQSTFQPTIWCMILGTRGTCIYAYVYKYTYICIYIYIYKYIYIYIYIYVFRLFAFFVLWICLYIRGLVDPARSPARWFLQHFIGPLARGPSSVGHTKPNVRALCFWDFLFSLHICNITYII
jgi:hypothetical protein